MSNTVIYYRRISSDLSRNSELFLEQNYADVRCPGLVPHTPALIDQPHSHEVHYANSVFEGIRAKPSQEALKHGQLELAILNFERNAARFFRSMEALGLLQTKDPERYALPADVHELLTPYDARRDVFIPHDLTPEKLQELLFELLQRNIKAGCISPVTTNEETGELEGRIYIRPVAHRASHPEGRLGVYSLQHDIVLRVLVQEWGDYLPNGIKLVVFPDGVEDPMRSIKSGANYALGSRVKNWAATFYTQHGTLHFDDGLITDTRRNIEEATGANFFVFVNPYTILTPSLSRYLLAGITRETTIELARNLGFTVTEPDIPIRSINGMPAAFLTGTATGLRSIRLIYDPQTDAAYHLNPEYGPFLALRREFNNLINGLPVSEKNKALQKRVRSVILPLKIGL